MTYRLFTIVLLSLLSVPLTSLAAASGLHDLRITFSSIPTLNCTTAGFRIYDDSATKIYETTNTGSNEITCPNVELTGTKATFTMTSFCTDGRESAHSAPFIINFPTETALKAVITPPPSSEITPFNVAFNGTNSIGSITNYLWTFGDGSPAVNGENVTHHFLSAAEYTVTLTVTDTAGKTASTHHTISVIGRPANNIQPTAVIAATTAVGDSPLSVTFDGSESSDADGDTLTYSWNFGDGGSSDDSTPSATHIYTIPGTYHATLTVSDGTNQTTSSPIPVIVADGGPATGQPTALITAGRTSGPAPFSTRFNGSASTPSPGADNIVQYKWTFGDGSTAAGKIVNHVFPVIGKYSVTLTVTDNTGTSNTVTVRIDVQEKNDITKLLPLIYKLLLLNNRHQHTEKL